MTTTDLALIEEADAEVVGPLNKTEAKRLDKQIRSKSDQAVKARDKVIDLVDELTALLTRAREGDIHKALGLKSWTAYVADAVALPAAPEREDRKLLVQFLSGQGMSQRAIAGTLNVSQKTVDRDLDGEEVEEGATVTSLDGAERPKNGKGIVAEEPIDAEVVDDEEDSGAPMTAAEIVTAFDDETANLHAAWSEMTEFMQEDKWSGARKRIAKANMETLGEIAKGLQSIIDDLMTG
jgi:transposase